MKKKIEELVRLSSGLDEYWRVNEGELIELGKLDNKEELIKKVEVILDNGNYSKEDKDLCLDNIINLMEFDPGQDYLFHTRHISVVTYETMKFVIERELNNKKGQEEIKKEIERILNGRTFEEYRREKIQEQAEYLVKREMERMRKKAGLKELLPYIPEVKVLSKEEWLKNKERNVCGYVNKQNTLFLPEYNFRDYDFCEFELAYNKDRKFIYRNNDEIIKDIKHELTHLFIREHFKSDIIGIPENDASPIFLYFLAFFEAGFGTGYKVQSKYENEVKEKIKGLTYEEIQSICLKFLGRLELILDGLKGVAIFAFDKDEEDYHIEERNGCICLFLGYNTINYDFKKFCVLNNDLCNELKKDE